MTLLAIPTINCKEGGTWTANWKPVQAVFLHQEVYIPKNTASYLYTVTDGDQLEQRMKELLMEVINLGYDRVAPKINEYLLSKYGFTIPNKEISYFISAAIIYNGLMDSMDRTNFRNAIIQCNENEYVRITRLVTYDTGTLNAFDVVSEIKDVYRIRGTFKPGYYATFDDIELQEDVNEK